MQEQIVAQLVQVLQERVGLDQEKATQAANVVVAEIGAIRARAKEFEENRDLVKGIVAEGCEKARDVARQTLEEVHQAMGMSYR